MKVIVFFAAICIFAVVMYQTNAEAKNIDEPEVRETRRVKGMRLLIRCDYYNTRIPVCLFRLSTVCKCLNIVVDLTPRHYNINHIDLYP